MENIERKLLVDDLILEYLIYKVKSGYEPKFFASEFIDFLKFYESKIPVIDSSYDKEILFKRFIERKGKEWYTFKDFKTGDKYLTPHVDINFDEDDYIISANYKLNYIDRENINQTLIDKNIIKDYLKNYPKRTIEKIDLDDKDLLIGKYFSVKVIIDVWDNYMNKQVENRLWPKNCRDINMYLFQTDLAKIINVPSIKNNLIELYNDLKYKISVLYKNDKKLKISSYDSYYLARSNYELIIKNNEKIISDTYDKYNKILKIDTSYFSLSNMYKGNISNTINLIEKEKVLIKK